MKTLPDIFAKLGFKDSLVVRTREQIQRSRLNDDWTSPPAMTLTQINGGLRFQRTGAQTLFEDYGDLDSGNHLDDFWAGTYTITKNDHDSQLTDDAGSIKDAARAFAPLGQGYPFFWSMRVKCVEEATHGYRYLYNSGDADDKQLEIYFDDDGVYDANSSNKYLFDTTVWFDIAIKVPSANYSSAEIYINGIKRFDATAVTVDISNVMIIRSTQRAGNATQHFIDWFGLGDTILGDVVGKGALPSEDWSDYDHLRFDITKTTYAGSIDLKVGLESGGDEYYVNISDYCSFSVTTNKIHCHIPLADFIALGVDITNIDGILFKADIGGDFDFLVEEIEAASLDSEFNLEYRNALDTNIQGYSDIGNGIETRTQAGRVTEKSGTFYLPKDTEITLFDYIIYNDEAYGVIGINDDYPTHLVVDALFREVWN